MLKALCLTALLGGIACSDDRPNVPAGPQTDVPPPIETPGHTDDDDGGPSDAGRIVDSGSDAGGVTASLCERIEVLQTSGGEAPTATSTAAPADFKVARQAVNWECSPTRITLELSDGTCPNGAGHELQISMLVDAVADGAIRLGNNIVSSDADNPAIRVRYTRPARAALPHGKWGTCAGADGQLVFLEAPEIRLNALLNARYSFTLTNCDSDASNDPILVSGAFYVTLRRNPSEACPGATP